MDWKRELEEHQADSLSVAVIRNFQIADTVAQGGGVTAHTRFQAASVSKMVFAAAVLRLAAEGRLSLEDDIGRYLGELPLHNAEGRPARATVSVPSSATKAALSDPQATRMSKPSPRAVPRGT